MRRRPVVVFLALLLAMMASSAYSMGGAAGRGVMRDDKNYTDRITLTMIGVPTVPRDAIYEAWLVTDNGIEQSSLGNLKVENDGTVRHAVTRDENFFARYNKLRISVEPRDKRDPKQAGKTVFEGEIPLTAMEHIRHLLVFFSEAPGGTALAIGARTQSSVMLKHVNQASAAASSGDLGKVKENAEAIVNIVEGSKGSSFGDLNGDQSVQNPGDGYGLLNYAEQASYHAGLTAESEGATAAMKSDAANVQRAEGNVGAWAAKVRDDALEMLKADNVDSVKPLLESMAKNGIAALNGVDANGNGLVEPIEGEGGAMTAYVHAQNIGTYDVRPIGEPGSEEKTAGSPADDSQAGAGSQLDEAPLGQELIPTVIFGLIAGTAVIAAMAFLWVKVKMGIPSR